MKLRANATIKATSKRVWEVFTDESKMGQWLSGFKRIESISGAPEKVGSKFRVVFEERGREMEFIETVLRVEKERLYAITLSHRSMRSDNTTYLHREATGTRLEQVANIRPRSFVMRLILPLMKKQMQSRMQADMDRLKQVVER